ncbi:MAG: NAD(+) synthase [Deltaproteobacteria bacterium]|nr:NAD(+) synthase [Deltaproteobacteria bacterium]
MSKILECNVLGFDRKAKVDEVGNGLKGYLRRARKRGLVVAISGGIDSSVSTTLCVNALGPKKVFGLLLPEHDSSSNSVRLGKILAEHLGIEYMVQDIAPTLEAIGCYKWRDDAIRELFPAYNEQWKCKIAIAGGQKGAVNYFNLIVESPDGEIQKARMGLKAYLQIVSSTSYKQRIRKTVEYFHADRLNYAVVGTPNRLEYDQGFFVKNGDGSADVKPIAHIYKTQVYALAEYLGLPEELRNVQPTTDTYSMDQEQDEFYFSLPYQKMDVALWCHNNGRPASVLAEDLGLSEEQAELIYKDIETKRSTTSNLHWRPVTIEKVLGPITQYES